MAGSAGIDAGRAALRGRRERTARFPDDADCTLLTGIPRANHPHHRRAARCSPARRKPRLVPTMGNLHEGHLSLVRVARAHGDVVVASIFVNRLQFAAARGFRPPIRAPASATASCWRAAGCDIVFAPTDRELYPEPQTLHGASAAGARRYSRRRVPRPDFFTGVCTVVMKLFNMRAARRGGVRQEGLPAAHGGPRHGAAIRAAHRDHRPRKPCATPTAWRCRRATAT